ncbi:LamG domain-containing protein [Luteolibacter pohnpeiensis]|uniref:LamG domain-containing protein n=1 Tax=Luteolibacter pohnpeiensis TaxID=454153 RepID=A0A934S2V4_9BACT|nr:LamG domain-containing protein [Luteolibacter pohnpeiensis]MBK1882145.1 LamG domain-containing protein [Luteolibacter pohnpeiensis]
MKSYHHFAYLVSIRNVALVSASTILLASTASAALVSQYDLEEGTGTVASQSVIGGAPDGNIVGSATWVSGIAPDSTQAVQVVSGSRIEIASNGVWGNLSGFSVSAWIQPTGFAGSGNTASPVFWLGTSGGSARFTLQMNDFGDLRVGGRRTGTETDFNGSLVVGTNVGGGTNGSDSDPIQLGQIYHVAATADYSTGLLSLYINGVLVASDTISAWGTGTTADEQYVIRIGSNAAGSEQFLGVIDDVRVYDTQLSASEVAALAIPEPTIAALGGFALLGWTLTGRRRIS